MSVPFQDLELRFRVLADKFVVKQLDQEKGDPLNFQPDTDLLAAFRLLVHAEFEDFIERKAKDALSTLKLEIESPAFTISGHENIYVLAAFFQKNLVFDCPYDADRFREAAKVVISEAEGFIKQNNGIKSRTLIFVSILHGRNIDEIDSSLANTLNQFGVARGDVAHVSASRVRTISAPSAELRQAEDLLKGLKVWFG